MKYSRQRVAKTIADRINKGEDQKKLSQEIAAYLLSERRAQDLSSLMRDVQDILANRGIVEVQAQTAHDLTKEVKADIKSLIKQLYPDAKKIVIDEINSPDEIGGVKLSLANQQLDLTIRTKLNKFKQLTA